MTKSKIALGGNAPLLFPLCLAFVLAMGISGCRRSGGAARHAPVAACQSAKDCGPGTACVVPGVCGRQCKTDRDCTDGRSCAEIRLMESTQAGAPAPATVTTCVIATPP